MSGQAAPQRRYRAATMREALAQVRRDLGGDAVILNTREVRGRRLFGLARSTRIEVVAHEPGARVIDDDERAFSGGRNPGEGGSRQVA